MKNMCRWLTVSPSGFFSWKRREMSSLNRTNRLARSGITCLSGFSSFDLEYPEVAKFDSAFSDQGIDDAIEKQLDGITN